MMWNYLGRGWATKETKIKFEYTAVYYTLYILHYHNKTQYNTQAEHMYHKQ